MRKVLGHACQNPETRFFLISGMHQSGDVSRFNIWLPGYYYIADFTLQRHGPHLKISLPNSIVSTLQRVVEPCRWPHLISPSFGFLGGIGYIPRVRTRRSLKPPPVIHASQAPAVRVTSCITCRILMQLLIISTTRLSMLCNQLLPPMVSKR